MAFITTLGYFFLVGVLFAVLFFFKGYAAILPDALGSKKRVRLIWLPAAAALWPLLLFKWISPRSEQ